MPGSGSSALAEVDSMENGFNWGAETESVPPEMR